MLPQVQVRREGEDYADQILSKAVKAGRRTYFFDVRATPRKNARKLAFALGLHYLCA